MDNDRMEEEVRKFLISLLEGETHMSFEDAVKDYPIKEINTFPPNGIYSPWQLLEHIRINQNDILDFIINPDYQQKNWPDDYWPARDKMANKEGWNRTVKSIKNDTKKIIDIVNNPKTNLWKRIPWGSGQNIFEEILKVSDHTSYHVGELGRLRQIMNTWPKNRKP
jgi:hypothetical protein